jgi:heme exporter protein CcmD
MTENFWAMGGYARFVWPCVAIAISGLAWNLWAAHRAYRHAIGRTQRAIAMADADRATGTSA